MLRELVTILTNKQKNSRQREFGLLLWCTALIELMRGTDIMLFLKCQLTHGVVPRQNPLVKTHARLTRKLKLTSG